MADLFDGYRATYQDVVADSISFSGLKHDFFMQAKADLIERQLRTRKLLGATPSLRCLDIGCGIGTMHPYIAPLFASIEGCDVSKESIDRASQEHPANRYTAYVPPTLPYEDRTFDFALAVCVVHHVPPQQWQLFFSEMRRVLKPGGLACLIEHNPINPATRLAVLRCPFDEDAVLLRSGTAKRLMRNAGFHGPKSEFFLLLPTANQAARKVEQALSSLSFGAQYACFANA